MSDNFTGIGVPSKTLRKKEVLKFFPDAPATSVTSQLKPAPTLTSEPASAVKPISTTYPAQTSITKQGYMALAKDPQGRQTLIWVPPNTININITLNGVRL